MKIIKVGLGNTDEAYIESEFSDGINIIFSNENNKGKTIVIQSMLYAIGNKPIFPSSFNYKEYYYYLEFLILVFITRITSRIWFASMREKLNLRSRQMR